MIMKSTYVGTYKLGTRYVRLHIQPDSGDGSVRISPDDKGTAIITVGTCDYAAEATGVLLHEVYELMLVDLNTRYSPNPGWSQSASDYIFMMTHEQLGEAHMRVGYFFTAAIDDFLRARRKLLRKKKK